MAIKGKTRRRARARGPAHPPRPQIPAVKVHLLQRTDFRRGLVVVLSLALLLGGLRVWQNISRSNTLERYERSLSQSTTKLTAALDTFSSSSLPNAITGVKSGSPTYSQLKTLAEQWEKDFKAAKDRVSKLRPPAALKSAQALFVQGIDQYVGVVRLLIAAAEQGELAAAQKDAKLKKSIQSSADVTLGNVSEWLQRAASVFALGQSKLDEYKAAWHVKSSE